MERVWPAAIRILVVIAILLALVWLAVTVAPLLEAVIVAGLLAFLLIPLVHFLERKAKLKHVWAARLVYGLFLLVLASLPTAVGAVVIGLFSRLKDDFLIAFDALRQRLFQPIFILGYTFSLRSVFDNLDRLANTALTALPEGSFDILSGLTTNILWGLVILVTLYYLLVDGHKLKLWLVQLAPESYQGEASRLLDELNQVWSTFLRAQLIITFILAVLIVAGTMLVIWLFRTGLLAFSWLGFILLLIAVYTLVQQVDNLWLHPQLMGKQLRLHPGIVFVGLVGALAFGGALGVIIVVPCIATAKVLGQYIRCKLLGIEPWSPATIPSSQAASPENPDSLAQNTGETSGQATQTEPGQQAHVDNAKE